MTKWVKNKRENAGAKAEMKLARRVTQRTGLRAAARAAFCALLAGVVVQTASAAGAHKTGAAGEMGEVVVTIKPLHALVQSVLGDTQKARLIVDGSQSPHGFALKPSQVRAIQHADVVFYVDPNFEGFMNKALRSAPKSVKQYPVMDEVKLELLNVREGGAWEAHAHHHGEEHGHDEGHHEGHDDHDDHHDNKHHDDDHHEHGKDHHEAKHHDDDHHEGDHHKQEKEHHESKNHDGHDDHDHHAEKHDDDHHDHHGEHGHLEQDMHVWLSPDNAKRIVRAVAVELGEMYPKHKAEFTANAQAQVERIEKADADLKKQLAASKEKPYIVFHDAYQYFEKHYGLNAVGSITLHPEESPSVRRVKEISQKIKSNKVQCVFSEPQFSDKLVNTVTSGTKVRTARLDPLGADAGTGENAYTEILHNLGKEIAGCLQ